MRTNNCYGCGVTLKIDSYNKLKEISRLEDRSINYLIRKAVDKYIESYYDSK